MASDVEPGTEPPDRVGGQAVDGPGRPLFAFAFRAGLGQTLHALAESEAGDADFVWVHLDLGNAAAQAWLRRRPWPPETVDTVVEPVQRGRLFATADLILGHLRDFRDDPGAATLHAGALSVVASPTLIVTGRHVPLLAVEQLRRRVESRTVQPASPFGLMTEFFRALNDLSEDRLHDASERVGTIEAELLEAQSVEHREDLLRLRRSAMRLARDMAYKRASMIELVRDRPALFPADEFRRFSSQVHRYAAIVEDAHELAEHCHFVLEEQRAQVAEETNRHIYVLTVFSAIILPVALIAGMWGMNVGGIPFGTGPNGFWEVGALMAAAIIAVGIILFRLRFL
jgi:zinc transporter